MSDSALIRYEQSNPPGFDYQAEVAKLEELKKTYPPEELYSQLIQSRMVEVRGLCDALMCIGEPQLILPGGLSYSQETDFYNQTGRLSTPRGGNMLTVIHNHDDFFQGLNFYLWQHKKGMTPKMLLDVLYDFQREFSDSLEFFTSNQTFPKGCIKGEYKQYPITSKNDILIPDDFRVCGIISKYGFISIQGDDTIPYPYLCEKWTEEEGCIHVRLKCHISEDKDLEIRDELRTGIVQLFKATAKFAEEMQRSGEYKMLGLE